MNAQTALVLVVDDDPEIRAVVADYLSGDGFRVATAASAAEARRSMERESADVVLLDLVLPDGDGLALLRELKAKHAPGVIMLTVKSEVVDRVVGLEMGADDYIAKPFHLRELSARVRSVVRRMNSEAPQHEASTLKEIKFGGWCLDLARRELRDAHGEPVDLTSGEFDLLAAFVRAPHRVLTRDELLEISRGRRFEAYDRAIDVQVGRLRRKIESDPSRPSLIKTVRGVGYVFTVNVEAR